MNEELLLAANRAQGLIIANNKQEVIQLANEMELWDIKVISYDELSEGCYYLGVPTFIWNKDEFIHDVLQYNFRLDYRGGA